MESKFFDIPGDEKSPESLKIPMARNFAKSLKDETIDWAEFVICTSLDDEEVVFFDVTVERPQIAENDIEFIERIAVFFVKNAESPPEVYSWRRNFPLVPHLNLQEKDHPKSLCLFDRPFYEYRYRWTPDRFINRIREWLALSAKGALHQQSQPLEPLLANPDGILIIPFGLSRNCNQKPAKIISFKNKKRNFGKIDYFPVFFECRPRAHGIIQHRPENLKELSDLLGGEGKDNIIQFLRDLIRKISLKESQLMGLNLVLIVHFPKTRVDDGPVESNEHWAFQFFYSAHKEKNVKPAPLSVIGERIGVFQFSDKKIGTLIHPDDTKNGEDLFLDVLNPIFGMDQKSLSFLNGFDLEESQDKIPKICTIGVGALGSQVVMNLARTGFGRWSIIDDDILMPHNLARHFLTGEWVGTSKANAIAFQANSLIDNEDLFSAIPLNLFSSNIEERKKIQKVLCDSDCILDMSASVAVARFISSLELKSTQRISLFLSPSGKDLVMITEGSKKSIMFDQLEMQYYRYVYQSKNHGNHLESPQGQFRYGQACRDLTSHMPQSFVALHSAIGSNAVKNAMLEENAQVIIWTSAIDGTVSRTDVPISASVQYSSHAWELKTDLDFISKIQDLRLEKLPNETGGILLGTIDFVSRIIYFVDVLPAPVDSWEKSCLFIRGQKKLKSKIEKVALKTDGMVEYIGEWHSHPEGVQPNPSERDKKFFSWIAEVMSPEGLPPTMMIVGDEGRINCFVENLEPIEIKK